MKVFILHASAGHGHLRAAEYLAQALLAVSPKDPALDVRVIDALVFTPLPFRKIYPWFYQLLVTRLSLLWKFFYWATNVRWLNLPVRLARRVMNKLHTCRLEKFLIAENPDVLVFTHFLSPEVCSALKRRGKIRSTLISVVTDFYPHSTWINPGTNYYVVMSERGGEVLRRWGVPAEAVKLFGIPVDQKFMIKAEKAVVRQKLGLDTAKFTLLLTSGSFGLGPMEAIIRILAKFRERLQLIVVCGKNDALKYRLESRRAEVPGLILGFVNNMDELMDASDVMVAKTGGLTTCESLVKLLPMIISQPIPGQEEMNARYLMEEDCAFQINQPQEIEPILQEIFRGRGVLERKQANIRKLRRPDAAVESARFIINLKSGG